MKEDFYGQGSTRGDFLDAARAGDVATARAMVTATAVHHNMYFAADMTVLIDAIAVAGAVPC
jgi:hypothetical protein